MWFSLRPVDLDFLQSAERSWVVECDVAAPLCEVWNVYVDPTTWCDWFPGVRAAHYRGEGPPGAGSIREAHVGLARYEEVMVAWEEGVRWAYYVSRATVPLAHAQLECTDFEDRGALTRLRWTLAFDRRLLLRLASPLFQGSVERLFRRATGNLEAQLAARRNPARSPTRDSGSAQRGEAERSAGPRRVTE